ncbi:ABC transporter permease [Gracilibacillus phocaeensis]|uniref:ABC transporter permease n=1 Tax=Gracilibacillus phocaeensis TaxID=2042304 RepID=UPI0010326570|nr:ABC transporter permease [Gracilibacillus phocaeensis]
MYYLKLAATNIRTNKSTSYPFLGSMIFLVMLNLLMQIIVNNDGMEAMPNGETLRNMFILGNVVIVLFSIIFAFYTNGFLMKSRQQELGLYNVLGMDKKNIGWLLFVENLLNMLIALLIGMTIGGAFSKFLFLVLQKITGFGGGFDFQLKAEMLLITAAITVGIFVLLYGYNTIKLARINPIDLLHGSKAGEKEPKTHWIVSILSFVCLGTGYYLSLSITSPTEGLPIFFLAIVLVIIGTYLLLIAASVTILKFLRNRERVYYRPKAFVNIAGMIYRMRQNGTGLASICILSTMVLVTISSTAGLFVGLEEGVRDRNPVDVKITSQLPDDQLETLVTELAEEHPVEVEEIFHLQGTSMFPQMKQIENQFTAATEQDFLQQQSQGMTREGGMAEIELIPLSAYQSVTGNEEQLAADEVMVFVRSGELPYDEITIGGQTFTIKAKLDSLPFSERTTQESIIGGEYIFIASDQQTIQQVIEGVNQDNQYTQATFGNLLMMNISGAREERLNFTEDLLAQVDVMNQETSNQQLPNENRNYLSVQSIDDDRATTQALNGGLLFLGLVFSLTFIIATALILYYKQISEGYEDAYRFEVMQKVGMSHKEVRQTIHSQILMVFLFPVVLAVIHLLFALPTIKKILLMFGLNNDEFFNMVTIFAVAIFGLCYLLVYWQTSRVYFGIVRRQG